MEKTCCIVMGVKITTVRFRRRAKRAHKDVRTFVKIIQVGASPTLAKLRYA